MKTQYGFHIIKVLDHEQAHTKSFEEVRSTIEPTVLDEKVSAEANDIAEKIAAAIRQSNHQPLDDLAKKFNLTVGELPLASATDPLGGLRQFSGCAHRGIPAAPRRIEPADPDSAGHRDCYAQRRFKPATRAPSRKSASRVLADYQQEKSVELAKSKAEELAKRAKGGEAFDKAAKSLNLDVEDLGISLAHRFDSRRWLRPIDSMLLSPCP